MSRPVRSLLVRGLLILIAATVLLLAGLAAWLSFSFDPNDHRARLSAEVLRHTGRELRIDGQLGLSVYPWLGVEAGRLTLADAPGFGDSPLARIDRLEARARLIPLLRGDLEIDRIVIDGLELKLVRAADGRTNWSPPPDKTGAATDDARREPRTLGAAVFALGGVDIRSARLTWSDLQSGVHYALDDVDLQAGEIRPGIAFPLALALTLSRGATSSAPATLHTRFELDTQARFDPARDTLNLSGLALNLAAEAAELPGGRLHASLRADVDADLGAGMLNVTGLTVDTLGLHATGQIEARALHDAPRFGGRIKVAAFDPRSTLDALGIERPPTADPAVLARAQLEAEFDATATLLELRSLSAVLDDTRIEGELAITDFARRALRFELKADGIELDRYLPPGQPATAVSPGAAAAGAEPSTLKSLTAAGRLRVGQLSVAGLTLSELDLSLDADGGLLRLEPLSASLYGGRYAGKVQFDTRRSPARLSLDESLRGVQLAPLLRDLTGKAERISGRADVRARLQADADSADSLRRSLAGQAEIRVADGAVKGVNVAHLMREASARLRGQPAPAAGGPNQTDFTALSATLKIAAGVIRNDDLDLRSPLLRLGGNGSASLVSETIDYRLRASLVATLTGQGGEDLGNLRGLTVPIRITGPFAEPAFALDIEALVSDSLRDRAREKIEERIRERIPENLQERLRGGLRDLLR